MDPDVIWKVESPLYSLPENGVHWFEPYVSHHHDVLRMQSTETDPCLLFRFKEKEKLDGLVCSQVDDSIGAGSEHFLKEEDKASKAFKSKGLPSKTSSTLRELFGSWWAITMFKN